MAKTLRVINPFFIMEVGDTLELTKDGDMYMAEHNEEFHKHGDDDEDITSKFSSVYTISTDYAQELIEEGYLEIVDENKSATKTEFVNVFTEIDNLLMKYTNELETVNKDFAEMPECLKVEKISVLKNMIKLLKYLKNLKK